MAVILPLKQRDSHGQTKPSRGMFAGSLLNFNGTFQLLKMPDQPISMSDREHALIETFAKANGLTIEEAANQLSSEALAKRYKRVTHKTPAKVYGIKERK